jgi:hypothetical protein
MRTPEAIRNCAVTLRSWQSLDMRSRILVLLSVAVTLLAGACGEISTSGSGTAAGGTPGDQEATKSPADIVSDAATVLQAADSYTVSFSGADAAGPLSFTLSVDTQSNATGTLTQNGQTSQVVYYGNKMYIQQRSLAQLLWQPALDASFNGKWVVIAANALPFVDTFRTPNLIATCAQDFASQAQTGSLTKVGGISAVPLILNDDNGNKNIITVALDGSAHLLSWQVKASASSPQDCLGGANDLTNQLSWAPTALPIGTFTFSGYQSPVNVVVPNTIMDAPLPTDTPTS